MGSSEDAKYSYNVVMGKTGGFRRKKSARKKSVRKKSVRKKTLPLEINF